MRKAGTRLWASSTSVVLVALLLRPQAAGAQCTSEEELLRRGHDAYDRLPTHVTSADAAVFADAYRFLFAYLQCSPRATRDNPNLARSVAQAYGWLSENLGYIVTADAKGDESAILSNASLRQRGLEAYDQLPRSQSISGHHAKPFIQAIANLYALHRRGGGGEEVRRAVQRLEGDLPRIVYASSSGRADDVGSAANWAPRNWKPLWLRNGLRIVRTRWIPQGQLRVFFDYTYSGDVGPQFFVVARPLGSGGLPLEGFHGVGGWLGVGRGSDSVTIWREDHVRDIVSHSISLCMIPLQQGSSAGAFYCAGFPRRDRWDQ